VEQPCRDIVCFAPCITSYKKRAVIVFNVGAERVSITGVHYGGQEYEKVLNPIWTTKCVMDKMELGDL